MSDAIELKLDEENELIVRLGIQGAQSAPQVVRIVCEGETHDLSIRGESVEGGATRFVVPSMVLEKGFQAGKLYTAKVEVVVENKYFVPAQFEFFYTAPVKVVAEAVIAPGKAVRAEEPKIVQPEMRSKPTGITFDVSQVKRSGEVKQDAKASLRRDWEESKKK